MHIRSDIAVGTYTLSLVFEDDLKLSASYEKVVEVTDLCITHGLQGVPGNGDLDMEYTIASYPKDINFPAISNGECDLSISLVPSAGVNLLSYGVAFAPIETQEYINVSIVRYSVTSDASLNVYTADEGLDG